MRSYYLAFELPARERGRLSELMRRLGDTSPLPHITLIAPPLLSEDLKWLAAVRNVARHSEPVTVTIGEPRTFGERVLYLAVASESIGALRDRLLQALGRTSAEDLADVYVAHLTLAVARRHRALPALDPPDAASLEAVTFTARELTIFRRDAPDEYRPWRRLELAGR